jgi:choline dehydrogenase-like flavoprotein
MNINGQAKQDMTYDAIVVGSGMSGGWSAKELTERGLKTLVLERGRNVEHVKDYPTMNLDPWELPPNDDIPYEEKKNYKKQQLVYNFGESTKHWWVKDVDQPYEEKERFDWIRGYHVGGRSIMWGRVTLRLSQMDFEANLKDGHGVDWPIRYDDIAPWYSYVEKFAGISGQAEGLPQLPDSEFLPPMELSCVEKELKKTMKEKFGRVLTNIRLANLTKPHNGRGQCMTRNLCARGCPYGAYFSSNAATLPAAAATGNLTMRPHSIVHSLEYDDSTGKVSGVNVIDELTGDMLTFHSKTQHLTDSQMDWEMIQIKSDETSWITISW